MGILFNNENLYWSTTVQEESSRKINKLRNTYHRFFILIEDDLNETYISKKEFFELVQSIKYINNEKIQFQRKNLAKYIWTRGGWLEETNIQDLIENLNHIQYGLKKTMLQNFNFCEETLNLYERNSESDYAILIKDLESLKNGKKRIHYPDSEILVDCHDLSVVNNLDIVFISSDGDIIFFKKEIKKMTNIKDLVFLKNAQFYPN